MKKIIIVVFLILGTVFFVLVLAVSGPFIRNEYAELTWHYKIDACKSIGICIIESLEKYYEDYGDYPEKIECLVPKYIDFIPEHLVGERKWGYSRVEKGRFELLFSPSPQYNYPCCVYDSIDKEWYINE